MKAEQEKGGFQQGSTFPHYRDQKGGGRTRREERKDTQSQRGVSASLLTGVLDIGGGEKKEKSRETLWCLETRALLRDPGSKISGGVMGRWIREFQVWSLFAGLS